MIFFIIFIVIIHVVLLLATYYNLNTLSKKERWLFILIGIGIMYFLSTIVFSITDIGIDYEITCTSDWDINAIIAYDLIHHGKQDLSRYKNMTKKDLIQIRLQKKF